MFVTLVDRYVTAIKNGAVPDVDDAFTAVAKQENAKIEKEALEFFENEMEKVTLPVPESELRQCYTNAQQIALDHLRKNVVHDFQAKCEIEGQRKMDAIWYEKKITNDKKVRGKCEKTLHNVYVKYLEKNIKNREYEKAGGHRRYRSDVEKTKNDYFSSLKDFKENEIISPWHEFVESMTEKEATIIEADENMSQKEKEAEQKKAQEKIEELFKQRQKAEEDALNRQKKIFDDHYEKLDKERREQQKINNEKMLELMKEKLAKEEVQKQNERLTRLQEDTEKKMACYRTEKQAAEERARRSDNALNRAEWEANRYKTELEEVLEEKEEALYEREQAREEAIRLDVENELYKRDKEMRHNEWMPVRLARAFFNV